jgi:uncharacterized protein involved in exopolysaccharide biosynthesis
MGWRKPASPREWLEVLHRHWAAALFVGLAIMILVTIVHFEFLHVVAYQWSADATFQRRNDVVMDVTGGSVIAQQISPIRQAIQESIRGRAAIEQLITDLNLSAKYNMPRDAKGELTPEGQMAMNDLILKIQRQLSVSALGLTDQTDEYSISFSSDDPNEPAQVVNRLVENYINKTDIELTSRLHAAQTFFETEYTLYAQKVGELDEKVARFAEENLRFDIGTADDAHGVHAKLADAVQKRDDLTARIGSRKAELAARSKAYSEMPDTVPVTEYEDNPEMVKLRATLMQLATEIETMRHEGLRDEHPRLKKSLERQASLTAQIAKTEEKHKVLKGDEPNVQKLELKQQLDLLTAQIADLDNQLELARANVEDLDRLNRNFYQVQREYSQLQQDRTDAREQKTFWESNLSRTVKDIAAENERRGLRLSFVRQANSEPRPSSPSRAAIILKVLAAGLLAALAVVVIAELLDRSYRSIDHAVDDLRLPILGAVNEIVTPARALRRRILNLGVFPAVTTVLLLLLLISAWVVRLSLDKPQQYDRLKSQPQQFLRQMITGCS